MSPEELYEQYPFNYANYMGFLRLYVQLFGEGPTAEELDLAYQYNHDNYLMWIGRAWVLGAEPPGVIEPVITALWVKETPITPIDFSNNFTGVVTSYSMTIVPTGLSFDTDTGVLSGTPVSAGGGSPHVNAHGIEFSTSCTLEYTVAEPAGTTLPPTPTQPPCNSDVDWEFEIDVDGDGDNDYRIQVLKDDD